MAILYKLLEAKGHSCKRATFFHAELKVKIGMDQKKEQFSLIGFLLLPAYLDPLPFVSW
jgi:hypothetical protein